MPTPLDFDSSTQSFDLPLLFPGQVQKEFFVNQALSVIDALLTGVLAASLDTPPTDVANGSAYRVTAAATGEWQGNEDAIAIRIADSWQFIQPYQGMSFFDQSIGQVVVYGSEWENSPGIAAPLGGDTVDTEARQAIDEIIAVLRQANLLPNH